MLADLALPLIIACCGMATSFKRFASIKRWWGVICSPSRARRVAGSPAFVEVEEIDTINIYWARYPLISASLLVKPGPRKTQPLSRLLSRVTPLFCTPEHLSATAAHSREAGYICADCTVTTKRPLHGRGGSALP
jgi:hypothetical protein